MPSQFVCVNWNQRLRELKTQKALCMAHTDEAHGPAESYRKFVRSVFAMLRLDCEPSKCPRLLVIDVEPRRNRELSKAGAALDAVSLLLVFVVSVRNALNQQRLFERGQGLAVHFAVDRFV